MNILKELTIVAALCASMGSAQAAVINGVFNNHAYDVVNFNVESDSRFNTRFISGYVDAAIGLFDSTGRLILFADDFGIYADEPGYFNPRLTQILAPGAYSLMVTQCCYFTGAASDYRRAVTDGFNVGRYFTSRTATLAGTTAYLDTRIRGAGGDAYQISLTNTDLGGSEVPEPSSVALLAASLGAMGLIRRRARHVRRS